MTTGRDLLRLDGVSVCYSQNGRTFEGLTDLSLALKPGEILGVAGESGSGKSSMAWAISRLLPANANYTKGAILFGGEDLLRVSEARMRELRGGRIGMVFQDARRSLNPTMTIGAQMVLALRAHNRDESWRRLRKIATDALGAVGISDPDLRMDQYPHEFSGGMLQRAMVGLAIALKPALLIADEPTSALDPTMETQVISLLARLREECGTSIILISHELGVVASICDRVTVLYAGQVAENADVFELFANPRHPYTRALLAAIPTIGRTGRLKDIPGSPPNASEMPVGCRFANRCEFCMPICLERPPPIFSDGGHVARCVLAKPTTQPSLVHE
jgi:oligopeptide/dipeptide ABC transporter ATP-binding protein